MFRFLLIFILVILSGCGGGDPQDGDRSFIGPPNCENTKACI